MTTTWADRAHKLRKYYTLKCYTLRSTTKER